MVRRMKGIAVVGVLAAAFAVIAPASAQRRSSVRRYARQTGGYRPLSRQQTIGTPLVQWGSHIQLHSSPFQGLPNPLQSPATFFQVPGRSYQPLMGSYRPLSSGYRPTRGGYAPLSRSR
ncbi:MAG: hypothetical protein ACO1SX_06240 [Actinomycetota bacterium]